MKKNNKKYRAVIIGAGQVAGGYDRPGSPEVVTHAHGYFSHPKVELRGFFDVDSKRSSSMVKKWKTEAFKSLEKMFETVSPEIVSVCVPDALHFEVLKKILKYRPKIVISEKPLTGSLSKSREILTLYKKVGVSLSVNYRRRFDETMRTLKDKLESMEFGDVLAAGGIYGKGLFHGGSHMIDLGRFLFGEVILEKPLFAREDYRKSDKTIGAYIQFKKCPQFHLLAGDERSYSIFELEIFCEKAKIRIIDEGRMIEIQKIIKPDNPLQKGYNVLGKAVSMPTKLEISAKAMVENLISHLERGTELASSGEEAFKTEVVCHNLLKQKII